MVWHLAPRGDDLEIGTGDHQGVVACDIELADEGQQILFERHARFAFDPGKCLQDRAVKVAEDLDEMRRRLVV